jgi:hypothetical protein
VHEATCVYCDALFCYTIVENPASEGTKAEAKTKRYATNTVLDQGRRKCFLDADIVQRQESL